MTDDPESECVAAMELVTIAFAVESLHLVTKFPNADETSVRYAVNLGALGSDGALRNLLPQALSPEGIPYQKLLWAAATLWGGASFKTQGSALVNDSVLGIVAPSCTVLLGMVCDPISFVQTGAEAELFMVFYGALPMLPRDPRTGFLKSQSFPDREPTAVNSVKQTTFPITFESYNRPSSDIQSNLSVGTDLDGASLLSDLVITFEPVLSNPSQGLFCAWFFGNLVFEIDPSMVFINTLKRAPENMLIADDSSESINKLPSKSPLRFVRITPEQLAYANCSRGDSEYGIFDCQGKPGWAVVATGTVDSTVVFCRTAPDLEAIRGILSEQDILIVFSKSNMGVN